MSLTARGLARIPTCCRTAGHERHAALRAPFALLALAMAAHAQGDVERISVDSAGIQADAGSGPPALSHDGRYVVFPSTAMNLVPGGTSGTQHVYLRDRLAGTTRLVTKRLGVEGNGDSGAAVISADGRFVAFHTTADNLGPVDSNGAQDVYLFDVQTDAFTLVSNGAAGGGGGTGGSGHPAISPDGRWVAFYSGAPDMVLNDGNGWTDAFVFDRTNLATPVEIVSVGPGGVSADFHSGTTGQPAALGQIAVVSKPGGNGCLVAFQSLASNLVPGANWGEDAVFLRDTQLATTSVVSASSTGAVANGACSGISMSADGRFVAFNSRASNLVPGDTVSWDTFVRDVTTGTTAKVTVSSQLLPGSGGAFLAPFPYSPSISADGRYVAYETPYASLVPNDTNGKNSIFVHDRVDQRTWRVDADPFGAQSNDHGVAPWISGDGRVVAFASGATDFVAGDTNAAVDVFVESFRSTTYGFCFGDGTGAACPCGNAGAPEKGCQNSTGTGGALLVGAGTTSVANDTFVLAASTMTPNTTVLFFQGTTQVATAFGDGLRCAGGSVLRIGQRAADATGSRSLGSGIAGDGPVSVSGLVPATGGTRAYQAWYRNPAPFCTAATFNLSNGLSATWTP